MSRERRIWKRAWRHVRKRQQREISRLMLAFIRAMDGEEVPGITIIARAP